MFWNLLFLLELDIAGQSEPRQMEFCPVGLNVTF